METDDHSGYVIVNEEEEKIYNPKKHLQCHVCDKILGHRSSLYKHLKYIHKIEPAHRLPISCHEEGCNQSFTFIDPFRRHLVEYHGFEVTLLKYMFETMNDFFLWKNITEQEENVRFIVSTGPRNSRTGKTHYFRCHRNGIYKPELKKRQMVGDLVPIHCIASMFVFEEADCVTVEYCSTHYGHDLNSDTFYFKSPRNQKGYKKLANVQFVEQEADSTLTEEEPIVEETLVNLEDIDEFLTDYDKETLRNVLKDNKAVLENTKELFYENENHVMLKISLDVIKCLLQIEEDSIMHNVPDDGVVVKVEPISDNEQESEGDADLGSRILQSLGNGIFLDTVSNKTIKIETNVDKNIEVLSEEEDDENVLAALEDNEKIVFLKRKKILSQLQTILLFVNEENNLSILNEIEEHLEKYAPAED